MKLNSRLSISITDSKGNVTKIGVIKGGHWGERLVARIRLWFYHRRRGLNG